MSDHHLRPALSLLVILSGIPLIGCGSGDAQPDAEWTLCAQESLSRRHAAQHARAVGARDALFARLLGELTGAMAADGPASAIPVCRDRAPAIADEVSAELGLEISRTSDRLRNPNNAAPEWASAALSAKDVSADPKIFVRGEDELRALLPIRIAPACLRCHGDTETLAAPVREALSESYPDDRATGYADGDLRGWFVVDVPSKKPG